MKKEIRRLSIFLFLLLMFFAMTGISEANFEGTIGTRFTITGSGFRTKKPQVYVEYKKNPGVMKKAYARVKTWSDTSITCLWTKTVSPGTYNIWVTPNIKGAVPSVVDTFSVMNPAIDNITLDNPNGKKITLTGSYFTNRKPKVYLKDLVSLRKKRCRVVSSTMDPATGASSLKFIVPKWGSDNYAIVLQTLVGETSFTLTSISGKITDSLTGNGVSGVTVSLTGTASYSVTTSADGAYSFRNVQNGSYTMTPFKSGYTFTPQDIIVTVNKSNVMGQDFVGTSASSPSGQLTLSINPTVLPTGTVNSSYSQNVTISASGGNPPYTYSCSFYGGSSISATITPLGPTNSSAVCTISGAPTTYGIKFVTFSVTDASQSIASSRVSLDVEPVSSPSGPSALDNWHVRTSGTTNELNGITYGNGTFVAVGQDTILTSSDGITWTSRDSTIGFIDFQYLYGVAYGKGTFVAVGFRTVSIGRTSGVLLTSPDGITWTPRNEGGYSLFGATYGNGTFVVVGDDTILTSPDGVTWTSINSGTTAPLNGVAYGNGTFVAVGGTGTGLIGSGAILTSTDGATWGLINSNYYLIGATYGNSTFVAVGDNWNYPTLPYYTPFLLTSPDGGTWTSRNTGTITGLNGVTYGNDTFVAVGWSDVNDSAILTSTDGATWTSRNSGYYYLGGVTYGNGTFVAVGGRGVIIQSDPVN